ncbi:hypothetical protein D9619_010074 [Psilocybe cf. subviscida]|uniref:MYND-type domain-containing protein n=1 Tax=Psilocybe cf. subviscida TaxID=2480587 RepID=A0A8H5F635_9AGAR|nr:hypothetical protein D9619_010074 [Psilocybe cf. subviscida]
MEPGEQAQKAFTQCQNCWKSELDGITLFRCGNCKNKTYCSKACQKAAWPSHKIECKSNQKVQALRPSLQESIKSLQDFTAQMRPTLAHLGVRAFELSRDPEGPLRALLEIRLLPRPDVHAYTVIDARVRPLDTFGNQEAEIRGAVKRRYEEQIRAGMCGGVTIMLWDLQSSVSNIMSVGYGPDIVQSPADLQWNSKLIHSLNEGIIWN